MFTLDVEDSVPLSGVTAITGPSGGGKTTLLRALAGLEAGAEARVRFRGEVWDDGRDHVPTEARRIGFVFQDPQLFPHLSVAGNLAYGAKRREVKSYDAIVDALELGPLMSRGVLGLSGGEQRRVALGRALASNPAILFLDEPLVGLDGPRKSELLPYVGRAVAEARVPALYVSHAGDEVTTLADRVLGLAGGRLTGWLPPPARLIARVIGEADGGKCLRIEGADESAGVDFVMPLRARIGERIGLGLPPDSVMVSAIHPGRNIAVAVLPGEVLDADQGLAISVFGQRLHLGRGGVHARGTRVWLSILRLLPRPEPNDSSTDLRKTDQ